MRPSVYPPHQAVPSTGLRSSLILPDFALGLRAAEPRSWGILSPRPPRPRANAPQKCQRPRTTGARTSGAAELFRGRPSAGAIKHQRRRWNPNRMAGVIAQGAAPLIRQFGTSLTTGPLTGGVVCVGCADCSILAGLLFRPNWPTGP